MMSNILQIYTQSPLRNYSYLIFSHDHSSAICIDPFDSEQIIGHLNGAKLVGIINTHEHFDHYCGNQSLLHLKPKVYAHHYLSKLIPGFSNGLDQESTIIVDKNSHFKVVMTPGHTDCHIGLNFYVNGSLVAVFTGDTLFNAGVGNCKNGGNVDALFETIWHYYQKLAPEVLVYPGHDYLRNNLEFTLRVENSNIKAKEILSNFPDTENGDFCSTIGLEKKINSFFRLYSKDIQRELGASDEKDTFKKLRSLRDSW